MQCADYIEWIARKLDGALAEDEARRLEEHLSTCSRCRTEFLLQRRIQDGLTKEVSAGLSADFTRRVSEQAREIGVRQKRAWLWARVIQGCAAAAVIVVVLLLGDDILRLLAPLAEPFSGTFSDPVAWLRDAIVGIIASAANLPRELIPAPLVNLVLVMLLGTPPAIWGFYQVSTFLRE